MWERTAQGDGGITIPGETVTAVLWAFSGSLHADINTPSSLNICTDVRVTVEELQRILQIVSWVYVHGDFHVCYACYCHK